MSTPSKKQARVRRHRHVRKRIKGTAERPRMAVHRSEKHLTVQLIDDSSQQTLAAASTMEAGCREQGLKPTAAGAQALGKLIAERALAADIRQVVFDRGGHAFHGRVKALADAAREGGLTF